MPLDRELEESRWRFALCLPSLIVGVAPFLIIGIGLCNRWLGYGSGMEDLIIVAKYANAVSIGLLIVGAALIASYTPVHKKLAVLALVLAAIGTVLHFSLYSLR